MVRRSPWRVYTVAPTEKPAHPYYHQTSPIVGGVRSRFLILQYPHKIFAITVKVDGG